jgi:hypothetical protein
MTVNSKISKQDYNNIQSLIASTLGVGQGNFGYGQPVRSSQVSESDKITINEWSRLRDDINSCYLHTVNSPPTSPTAVENATVRSDEVDSPYTRYKISLIHLNQSSFANFFFFVLISFEYIVLFL